MDRQTGLYVALAALTMLYIRRRATKRKVNHPPSPSSLPLLGNLLAMPSDLEHLAYMKLSKQLDSDIIFLELLGNQIVVLNSAKAASELLDKRSAIYSNRLCPPMLKDPELFDWSRSTAMIGYNDLWRQHRRMMNRWLNPNAVTKFNHIQERQSRLMLRRLLEFTKLPQPFEQVNRDFFFTMASSMFQVIYGYRLTGHDDPFFINHVAAMHNGMKAVMFTNFYVNLFPALVHIPSWVPGTGWKNTIRTWRQQKDRAVDEPYEWARAQVNAGAAEPSIVGLLLQEHSLTEGLSIQERDSILKEVAMALFIGGTDTTATALTNFVAAMISYPEIQTKAQQEIDTVLGPDGLPTIADRLRLPYVNNLILELLRWRPVSTTGVPHVCLEDDVYRGYDILEGTIVMGNIWAITRDEKAYPEPDVFNPDRFLNPDIPSVPYFGWGRRICPGIHFGEASLFITIASLLSAYTFSKKKDDLGNEIEPKLENGVNAVVLALKPFEFEFKPRSENHIQHLQNLS